MGPSESKSHISMPVFDPGSPLCMPDPFEQKLEDRWVLPEVINGARRACSKIPQAACRKLVSAWNRVWRMGLPTSSKDILAEIQEDDFPQSAREEIRSRAESILFETSVNTLARSAFHTKKRFRQPIPPSSTTMAWRSWTGSSGRKPFKSSAWRPDSGSSASNAGSTAGTAPSTWADGRTHSASMSMSIRMKALRMN